MGSFGFAISRFLCGFALVRLALDKLRHEQVGPLHLDVRRNATRCPVMDTLNSAVFVVAKKLGYLCGTAKRVDKCFVIHGAIKHRVDFNVNTMFVNAPFSWRTIALWQSL